MQLNYIRDARRLAVAAMALVLVALLMPPAVPAQPQGKDAQASKESKDKEKEKENGTTSLRIEVKGEKSEAVDNASVYVKYQHERMLAKDKTIEMNVKTNGEGIARVPSVPRGKVLVQVIAPGWKTFGQWYELSSNEQTIKITLQRPPRWY